MTGDATPPAVLSRRTVARAAVLAVVTALAAGALGGPTWVVVAWVPAWLVVVEAWVGARFRSGARDDVTLFPAAFAAALAPTGALLHLVHVEGVLAGGFAGGHAAVADAFARGLWPHAASLPFGEVLVLTTGLGVGASAAHLARAASQVALASGARSDFDAVFFVGCVHGVVALALGLAVGRVRGAVLDLAPFALGVGVLVFLGLGASLGVLDRLERRLVTASR